MGYPIEELRGIGPAYGAALRGWGFASSDDLLGLDPVALAGWLDPLEGITAAQVVSSLVPQAELLRLTDCPPSCAADLVEAGVTSYGRAAYGAAEWLAGACGLEPDDARVAVWQRDAARRMFTAFVRVQVRTSDGDPVPEAHLSVADPAGSGMATTWEWDTDERGSALLDCLAPGAHTVHVDCDQGWARVQLAVASGSRQTVLVVLQPGESLVVDEYRDGVSLLDSATVTFTRLSVDSVEDLPGADVFLVTAVADADARVTSARYRQVGPRRQLASVTVPAGLLPPGTVVGSLVTWDGTAFTPGPPGSLQQWRHDQLFPQEA